MWNADVTSSHFSPGFGWTRSRVKAAFSAVLRERSSYTMRDGSSPRRVKKRAAASELGGVPWHQRAGAAGEHEARLRKAARQAEGFRHALAGFVERTGRAQAVHAGIHRAAEHDDAVGRKSGRQFRAREAVLDGHQQHVADRRQAEDGVGERAERYQPQAAAPAAAPELHHARHQNNEDDAGGVEEKPDELRYVEEHGGAVCSRRYFS